MSTPRMAQLICVMMVCGMGCGPGGSREVETRKNTPAKKATKTEPAETAESFAREFAQSVQAGKANSDQLTTEFKKIIAPPVFPSDASLGFSDAAAGQWLKRHEGQLTSTSVTAIAGTDEAPSFIGSGWLIRVVPISGSWKVDWFGVGPTTSSPSFKGPEFFSASAFLNAVLSKQVSQASAVMTADLKQRLAPPFSTDKAGFNQGLLSQRLSDLCDSHNGFTFVQIDSGSVKGELFSNSGRKQVLLKLSRGERSWDWRVSDYKVE